MASIRLLNVWHAWIAKVNLIDYFKNQEISDKLLTKSSKDRPKLRLYVMNYGKYFMNSLRLSCITNIND